LARTDRGRGAVCLELLCASRVSELPVSLSPMHTDQIGTPPRLLHRPVQSAKKMRLTFRPCVCYFIDICIVAHPERSEPPAKCATLLKASPPSPPLYLIARTKNRKFSDRSSSFPCELLDLSLSTFGSSALPSFHQKLAFLPFFLSNATDQPLFLARPSRHPLCIRLFPIHPIQPRGELAYKMPSRPLRPSLPPHHLIEQSILHPPATPSLPRDHPKGRARARVRLARDGDDCWW
jgi:hypothetical protein